MFGFSIAFFFALLIFALYLVFNKRIFIAFFGFFASNANFALKFLGISQLKPENFDEFYAPILDIKYNPVLAAQIAGLSILIWLSVCYQLMLIASAFGANIPVFYSIAVVCIGAIVSLIPVTISGFGTRDATQVAVFSLAGVASGIGLLSSISYTIIGMGLPAIVGGLLYFRSDKVKKYETH